MLLVEIWNCVRVNVDFVCHVDDKALVFGRKLENEMIREIIPTYNNKSL